MNALRYCLRPQHLYWTVRIALIMGIVYTAVNQGDVILGGHADATLYFKVPMNFLAPFVVANIGLLGSRSRTPGRRPPTWRRLARR
jgi:hypothetical protein